MIDIHSHILPGLDDGAVDLEEAVCMAEQAVEDGIEAIVCTPHWVRGFFDNDRKRVLEAVAKFREKLDERNIDLTIYPGAELRVDADLGIKLDAKELLTLNDTGLYALVELSPESVPLGLEKLFFELQSIGITPVLAHPERNLAIIENPGKLYAWIETGILTQITAASLLGRFGMSVQKFAVYLLEHRMAHILATDAHELRIRTPKLSEAVKVVARIAGADVARQMVHDRPLAIIRGQDLFCPAPVPVSSRKSDLVKKFLHFLSPRTG